MLHMPPTLSPQEFVNKWRPAARRERANVQEHFIDLCHLVGHPMPVEADPGSQTFTFEAGVTTASGHGWADVWKKGFFGWEYKGHHGDLERAYAQLQQYREALVENLPLLIVSDLDRIVFTPTLPTGSNA